MGSDAEDALVTTQLLFDLSAKHEHRMRDIDRLVPIMLELAERAGPFDPQTKKGGVTVCNLRHAAVRRGVLTGGETGRTLSYLRQVPIRAKLHATGFRRMSDIPKSRNDHMIYVHPKYVR